MHYRRQTPPPTNFLYKSKPSAWPKRNCRFFAEIISCFLAFALIWHLSNWMFITTNRLLSTFYGLILNSPCAKLWQERFGAISWWRFSKHKKISDLWIWILVYIWGQVISEWKFDVFNFSKKKQKDKESSETDLSWPLISSQLKVLY